MAGKERLDKLLVDRGLCVSRTQAQALIMDGKVRVGGEVITKPGTPMAADSEIELAGVQPYVSRGGLKLEKALSVFSVEPQGKTCMDVGAATGGFTDCLLQHGAERVIAVDVGYGQLEWKLRQDSRVQVLEKTNIRDLKPENLVAQPSLGVVDTSFISLKKVLPPLALLLAPAADMITLLKPQFEYRDYLQDKSFKGVVRGAESHRAVITGVLSDLDGLLPAWHLKALDFSPITGPKGNIEFLLHYQRGQTGSILQTLPDRDTQIDLIIAKSYETHGLNP
jgi:23S rRNA (cytidine1920-2'-O)/16S rRNA (cytidine1409-2'-O)-methyltransferase